MWKFVRPCFGTKICEGVNCFNANYIFYSRSAVTLAIDHHFSVRLPVDLLHYLLTSYQSVADFDAVDGSFPC